MKVETKVYYDKVTVTPEERELLKAVYKMIMEIYDGEIHKLTFAKQKMEKW